MPETTPPSAAPAAAPAAAPSAGPLLPAAAPRRRRPAMLAVITLLALVAVLGAVRLVIAIQTSPASLVKRMESLVNSRVEIADTSISLARSPAEIRLRGFRLGARDTLADNAVPLRERPVLNSWFIGAEEVTIEASIWSVLTGRLTIEDLRMKGSDLDARINKKGEWNILKLFDQPDIVNGKPNPLKQAKPPKDPNAPVTPGGEAPEYAGPKAQDFAMAGEVKHFLFEGNKLRAFLKKKETDIDVSGLRLEVENLDVDPKDLAHHNGGKLRIKGVVKVRKSEPKADFAIFHIEGEGTVRPFDPASGVLNPMAEARITLLDPSSISLLPSLQKIAKKVETLKKFGIDAVDEIGESVDFKPGTTLDLRFADGRLVTASPLRASAGNLDIEVQAGGWVVPASSEHELNAVLLADDKLSAKLRQQVQEKSNSIPGAKAKEEFLSELDKNLFPEGKFRPTFLSNGDLGNPDVELTNKLPDLGKLLRGMLEDIGVNPEDAKALEEAGRGLLDGLLKKKDKEKAP